MGNDNSTSLNSSRVLIISQDDVHAVKLDQILAAESIPSQVVKTPKTAAQILAEQALDLIILDADLSELTHDAQLISNAAKPLALRMQVILLVDNLDEDALKLAKRLAAVDILIKPIKYGDVGYRIANLLKLHAMQRSLVLQNRALKSFSLAVEQNLASIVITDVTGNIEYVNHKFQEITGYSAEEVHGENPRILKSGRQNLAFYQNLWETITSGKPWQGEFQNKKKTGELFWESAIISPLKNKGGEIIQYVAVKEDITADKRLQVELFHKRETERILNKIIQLSLVENDLDKFLKSVHEIIKTAIDVGSLALGLISEDQQALNFIYSVDERSDNPLPRIPLDARDSMAVRVVKKSKTIYKQGADLAKLIQKGKGLLLDDIPCAWLGVPLLPDNGCKGLLMMQFYEEGQQFSKADIELFESISGQIHMVLERIMILQKIALSERRFRIISETANDAIGMMNSDGKFSFINQAGCQMFGYAEEELIGQSVHVMISPSRYAEQQKQAFEHFQHTGTGPAIGKTLELVGLRQDKSEFPIEMSLSSVKMADGWNAIAIIRDITEKKKMTETMRRLTGAIEQNEDSIIITDANGTIEYVNPAFTVLTGFAADEVLDKNWTELQHIDDFGVYEQEIKQHLSENIVWNKRRKSKRKDGSSFDEATRIAPILDSSGVIRHIVLSRRDISQEMILEQQLRQSQKLESIGQLAAGIAHEINTPAQYVSDNIKFISDAYQDVGQVLAAYTAWDQTLLSDTNILDLKRKIDYGFLMEEIHGAIEQSREGISHISRIVKAIKEFSHPAADEKKLLDLNRAIETTITVARNEWKYVAEVTTQLDPELPMVECLPGEINQVILNIIINAAHAIGDVVDVETKQLGLISITSERVEDAVRISIKDTGSGIPLEAQPRIFDPFFTTKPVGKGTGQGLSLAHMSIVNKHDGRLYFETTAGVGTTFFIELPIQARSRINHDAS